MRVASDASVHMQGVGVVLNIMDVCLSMYA